MSNTDYEERDTITEPLKSEEKQKLQRYKYLYTDPETLPPDPLREFRKLSPGQIAWWTIKNAHKNIFVLLTLPVFPVICWDLGKTFYLINKYGTIDKMSRYYRLNGLMVYAVVVNTVGVFYFDKYVVTDEQRKRAREYQEARLKEIGAYKNRKNDFGKSNID